MASTFKPRNWRSTGLKIVSNCLYAFAILAGFAAMYPAYSLYDQVERSQYVAAPASGLLTIVIALLLVGMGYAAGQAYEFLERKRNIGQ